MITNNLYVIAAICGNFWQESTVNPGIWEGLTPNAPGYGLGQWTDNPPVVMRRTALFNWLDANGYARDSGDGQLAFLLYENIWIPSTFTPSAYNTLSDFLASSSTDLAALTREWMYHWEGIDDGSYSTRYQFAQRYLTLMQNDDGTRRAWYAGNYYLTYAEADLNVLHIMDYFIGEEPPPPPPPEPPREDELIALLKLARKKKLKGGIFIAW